MPRRARVLVPGVPLHVIQRGNNRSDCFHADSDYRFYLHVLSEQARKHGCAIHAYCLMTNHVHLLLTPAEPESIGLMMKGLGQRYVQYFNRTYQRSGTLWEGRFRSCVTEDEAYVLTCYRYIELNPVRAGMVEDPAQYRWSSYRCNAQGEASEVCTGHRLYQSISTNASARQAAYRELLRQAMAPDVLDRLRRATNGNFALGNAPFLAGIEQALGRRVVPGTGGRPFKTRAQFALDDPSSRGGNHLGEPK
jgi:putative transposase